MRRWKVLIARREQLSSVILSPAQVGYRCAHTAVTNESKLGESQTWRIVKRPILETYLRNYAHSPAVVQPLILHGPRGVGKRTIIEGLVDEWRKAPHAVAYLNLHSCQDKGSECQKNPPWMLSGKTLFENQSKRPEIEEVMNSSLSLGEIRVSLERSLESLTRQAVEMGCIGGDDVMQALLGHHTIDGALTQFLNLHQEGKNPGSNLAAAGSTEDMWGKALRLLDSCSSNNAFQTSLVDDFGSVQHGSFDQGRPGRPRRFKLLSELSLDKKEALVSLALAKEVLQIQETWKKSSDVYAMSVGVISNAASQASTSWPILLLRLLHYSVREGYFQPKLVINSVDLMRKAGSWVTTTRAALYHDSFFLQILKMAHSGGFIPIILVSSDSYYSKQILEDHGDKDAFVFQEVVGWTPAEAAIHLVPRVFEESEWQVITSVLGSNARHLFELNAVWQSQSFLELMKYGGECSIEDCIELYLGYLQVTAVDPAIEAAILIIERFAEDGAQGRLDNDIFRHGAPWRYPPSSHEKQHTWARLQLMDFLQAFSNADFALNYEGERAHELLEDPSANALVQVSLLYQQGDPPYLRPTTRGVLRCLVRWLVREKLNLNFASQLQYSWHRLVRGRFYRQLLVD